MTLRNRVGVAASRMPVVLCLLIGTSARAAQAQPGVAAAPPTPITAEQDHQRMMDLLHITSLRRGADGNPNSPRAANSDETKATPFPTLPDPLVLKNGARVASADTWWKQRRPEIVEDFDREVYGRVPKNTPGVKWEVVSTTREMNGGFPVITRKLLGHVDNTADPAISVDIQLTVATPAKATRPVPLMMEFGFTFPAGMRRPGPPGIPAASGPTWQQQLLAKGWGYAELIPTSIQADNGAGLTKGIIGLVNKGQPRKADDWGALRAWAWGADRALDYLETDPAVNAKEVGIEGLSRYGKAAAVTMAYAPRFAIGFIASSGEGGVKLHRRNFGEQVENVASSGEYHWMAGNFLKYAGPLTPNDLPVDSHELVALCAPRPVFISCGSPQVEGNWVDDKGMFLGGAYASPVYALLGKKGLGTTEMPPMETALIDGDIAFRQHSGGHTAGPNWPTFLQFAGRYIQATPLTAATISHPALTITADRPTGIYTVGDTVHWTVTGTSGTTLLPVHYTLKSGGFKVVAEGDVPFTNGTATFDSKFGEPGTMLARVTETGTLDSGAVTAGAVAAPERITPAVSPPKDFDAFWDAKKKELKTVALNPVLEPGESGKPTVSYWKVTLDNIRGTHIHGQIARPAQGRKFPALLVVQWAGVYGLQKGWAVDRAADGWLTLNIEPHDLPIDESPAFYAAQAAGPLRNYWNIGNDDREASYFLRMYLSCCQAVEYLKSRPDWDGKTLVVMGTSQGGQQTLMTAGLHPDNLTAGMALVPSGCDMLAPEAGRATPFPHWYDNVQGKDPVKVRETSRYFDPANFARHIRCPILIGLGLRDETSPPSSVLAAAHEIHSPRELLILPTSGHQDENGSQMPYVRRVYGGWLPALKQGKPAPVNQVLTR